jgi:hypothetical protein
MQTNPLMEQLMKIAMQLMLGLTLLGAACKTADAQICPTCFEQTNPTDPLSDENDPYWLEASAYSAELNLSSGALRLIPMVGDEVQIDVPTHCLGEARIDDGVYAISQLDTANFELHASYPEASRIQFDQGDLRMFECGNEDQPTNALRLPNYAMQLLAGYDVGAIYLHR